MFSQQSSVPNPRYKTSLCRNWEEKGKCTREENCHFAHGKDELREPAEGERRGKRHHNNHSHNHHNNNNNNHHNNNNNHHHNNHHHNNHHHHNHHGRGNDNNRGGNNSNNQGGQFGAYGYPGYLPVLQTNYKTVLCKFYTAASNEAGQCKFGDQCHFAHGKEEMRKPPNNAQNAKIIELQTAHAQQYQQVIQLAYLSQAQAMRMQQQMVHTIAQLSTLSNQKLKAIAEQARQNMEAGNFTESANLLNQIFQESNQMNDLSQDDRQKIQLLQDGALGNNPYAQVPYAYYAALQQVPQALTNGDSASQQHINSAQQSLQAQIHAQQVQQQYMQYYFQQQAQYAYPQYANVGK